MKTNQAQKLGQLADHQQDSRGPGQLRAQAAAAFPAGQLHHTQRPRQKEQRDSDPPKPIVEKRQRQ